METFKLDYFFAGKLGREEVASAWLATLLTNREFRSRFLKELKLDDETANSSNWVVSVEKDQHDLRLTCNDREHLVIIENKIHASAIRRDQLKTYYLQAKQNRQWKNWRMVAVFLTPRPEVGSREIQDMLKLPGIASQDVKHLHWESIGTMVNVVGWDASLLWFVETGFRAIMEVIKSDRIDRFPLVNGREIIGEIQRRAKDLIEKDASNGRWTQWRHKEKHRLFNVDGIYTVLADIMFSIDDRGRPDIGIDHNHVRVILRIRVQLSQKGRNDKARQRHWKSVLEQGLADKVPGLGKLQREEGRRNWLYAEVSMDGDANNLEPIAAKLAAMAQSALEWTRKL